MREIEIRDCSTCKYFEEEYNSEGTHCDGCLFSFTNKYSLPIVNMRNWEKAE